MTSRVSVEGGVGSAEALERDERLVGGDWKGVPITPATAMTWSMVLEGEVEMVRLKVDSWDEKERTSVWAKVTLTPSGDVSIVLAV